MLDKNFVKENIKGIQELLEKIRSFKEYSIEEIVRDIILYHVERIVGMALFYRPSGQSGGILQQDHYYRFADLCFRHLKGAYDQHNEVKQHMWIKSIDNDKNHY